MLNLDNQAIERLVDLGLAEQKLGGIGLSYRGKQMLEELAAVIVARRAKNR